MGDIPTDRPPTRTRIPAPANDVRPGLPAPGPRAMQPPQYNTTGLTGGDGTTGQPSLCGSPGNVKIQTGPTGKPYAVGGTTTTQTGGFGKQSPSGTGLTDQKTVSAPKPAPWWQLKPKKDK